MDNTRVRMLTEGAVAAALSLALSFLKVFQMPQGGSITLEMVPLLAFAAMRGVRAGAMCGATSGLLQMMLNGYVVNPVQAVLDYPLAFGLLALGGLQTRDLKGTALAMILAGLARLTCHVLSGVIFFASFAPEGSNVWVYSITYNATFLVPSLAISMLIALPLVRRLKGRI
ncbi:energy-coupled thiamine transporter ThiT [Thermanaerovibrio acidaminovorans]|uniref:Proton-coupled thiamine transporter YuaJ n=1 Tax=Thermanaerovibrio acidaminovorans (strain ATCC 49978 / DSM 6589 / Su883) TaxID=525903 RepID=D1B8A9_THEAS|nr:energy-coupled thiamine transporter ThiT [Thermanaerovibrio acidaminovorans]ACZ18512.1 proton-coupled thiamine transporter YuaJ [Thermanaerovibrio acidaminovorans DSM 6589]